ncbi:MAG: hypothetical protein IPJ98_27990 [Bryobacterales bacterium]|nr:hypothetical protein [Bryobacterales bacterium]
MQTRIALLAIAVSSCAVAQTIAVEGIKTGLKLVNPAGVTRGVGVGGARKSMTEGRVYRVVQFDHMPEAADLEGLAARGMTALQYVPENAVMVSMAAGGTGLCGGVAAGRCAGGV